jgi:hypothetical protein
VGRVVRLTMLRHLIWAVLIAILAACDAAMSAPPAIQPTLSALRTLGFVCDAGIKDNVPSGLYQWHCRGTEDGVDTTVLVDGKAAGVAEIDDDHASIDPAVAVRGFGRLVASVPPLRGATRLVATLDHWTGEQQSQTVDGVRVTALCDVTQCIVFVVTASSPLDRLPLP